MRESQDSRGLTDPLRYQHRPQSPTSLSQNERPSSDRRDMLPGVSQLLKPPIPPLGGPTAEDGYSRDLLSISPRSTVPVPAADQSHAHTGHVSSIEPSKSPRSSHHRPSNETSHFMEQTHTQDSPLMYGASYARLPLQLEEIGSIGAQTLRSPFTSHNRPSQSGSTGRSLGPSEQDSPSGISKMLVDASEVRSSLDRPLSSRWQTHDAPDILGAQRRTRSPEAPTRAQLRVVSDAVVPGGGEVWVYTDGSTCPKKIGEEEVIPQWGVTKAGKPRKRLAIACTTCREKKIKCDPESPKCAQCEKSGKECRYEIAPRNHRNSPSSPGQQIRPRKKTSVDKPLNIKRSRQSSASYSPEMDTSSTGGFHGPASDTSRLLPSPIRASHGSFHSPPVKKRRSDDLDASLKVKPIKVQERVSSRAGFVSVSTADPTLGLSRHHSDGQVGLGLIDWEDAHHYIVSFFDQCNGGPNSLFPRASHSQWSTNLGSMSSQERCLVYAVLALGALVSAKGENNAHHVVYLQQALDGLEAVESSPSLPSVQASVVLALYYSRRGDEQRLQHFSSTALRMAIRLGFHAEDGCADTGEEAPSALALFGHGLVESRRRAFWCSYMLKRSCTTCGSRPPMIQSEDILLRLPCREDTYSDQRESRAPFYDNGLVDPGLCRPTTSPDLSAMAYFVELSSIGAEVSSFNRRRKRQEQCRYNSEYEDFSQKIAQKLYIWRSRLPAELHNNGESLAASVGTGSTRTLVELHCLYLGVNMRMNRYFYHMRVPSWSCSHKVVKAKGFAEQTFRLLQLAIACNTAQRRERSSDPAPYRSDESWNDLPYCRQSLLLAIDILTAGGSLQDKSLREIIQSVTAIIPFTEGFPHFSDPEPESSPTLHSRLEALERIESRERTSQCKAWRCRIPLDTASTPDLDIFFPANHQAGVDSTLLTRYGIQVGPEEVISID